MKVAEHIVQDGEKHDDCLHRRLFDVNMRLFNTNGSYREIIDDIIHHMCDVFYNDFEDYASLKGISGANVGIPFNIVVISTSNDANNIDALTDFLIMINPQIVDDSGETVVKKSNCGSVNLPKSIDVERYTWVRVAYYDENGKHVVKKFTKYSGTVQHEIEHNLGILITDKQV